MKINENDIRMMNRMMAAEMLLKEAMVGTDGAESNSIPEQVTLYSLIHEMSGLLRDSTVIMKEIGDLVKKYEDNDWEDAGDEDVGCDSCPCYDICWLEDVDDDDDEMPFMVMIAVPGHGFSVMKDSKAEYDYPELFPNGNGSKDLTPVPGTEDVYYTFSSQSKRSANGKTYVSSPVMIMKIDEDAGEFISPDAMDASDYGVPQNRCRTCIIGYLGNHTVQMPEKHTQKVTIWDAISDLAFLGSGEGAEEQNYPTDPQTEYQAFLRGKETVLHNHTITKHSKIALERLSMIPPEGGKEHLPAEHLTKSIYSGTWTRMSKNEQSVTITTRFDTPSSGKFTHPYLNRAISVREAARIQSFPDSFVFYGNKSSQMKQVGNAVPPLLAYEIARAILNDMENPHIKTEDDSSQLSLWDVFPEQAPSKA